MEIFLVCIIVIAFCLWQDRVEDRRRYEAMKQWDREHPEFIKSALGFTKSAQDRGDSHREPAGR